MNQICSRSCEFNFDSKNANPLAKLHVCGGEKLRMGKARVHVQGERNAGRENAHVFCIPFSLAVGLVRSFFTDKQTAIFCSGSGPRIGKVATLGLSCSSARPQQQMDVGWAGGSREQPSLSTAPTHPFAEEINISCRSGQQRSQFIATLSMYMNRVPEHPQVLLQSKITAEQNNSCNKHSSFQKGQI